MIGRPPRSTLFPYTPLSRSPPATTARGGCSASHAPRRTCWHCSHARPPAAPPSRTCCSAPTGRFLARPEAGLPTPEYSAGSAVFADPAQLLAVPADGGRGSVLVLSRALRGGALRGGAHRLLCLLRQRAEGGAGGLLEGGDHLAQAVGGGERRARSEERRQHIAPFAPPEDAVERHVHLGNRAPGGVVGLEAPHRDLQQVVGRERAGGVLHRPPRARGAQRFDGQRFDHVRSRTRSAGRSEEHTSELQSRSDLVCRLLLEKKKKRKKRSRSAEK